MRWRHVRRRGLLLLLLTLWLAGTAGGYLGLLHYASAPGEKGTAPPRWPEECGLTRAEGKPTLLMFVHPQCPCTRASLDELARLLAHCGSHLSVQVLFFKPAGTGSEWERTDLWHSAEALPSVQVAVDLDRRLATQFGVATSGDVLLYGADGQLRFHGGITSARGHAGDSVGSQAIEALVTGSSAGLDRSSVFGCALHDGSEDTDGKR